MRSQQQNNSGEKIVNYQRISKTSRTLFTIVGAFQFVVAMWLSWKAYNPDSTIWLPHWTTFLLGEVLFIFGWMMWLKSIDTVDPNSEESKSTPARR